MRDFARGAMFGCVVLLLAAQFVRPARTNPPIDPSRTLQAAIAVPPAVQQVITRACYDCHSDLTRWPWYSHVAPTSWFVIGHVNEGRRYMDFSEWLRPGIKDPVQYTLQKFHTACARVQTRKMPLRSYLLLHPDARLSPADVQTICTWAEELSAQH